MTRSTTTSLPAVRNLTTADFVRIALVTAASAPVAWLSAMLLSHRTVVDHEKIGAIVFTVLMLGNAVRYSMRSWTWSGIFLSGMLLFPLILDRRCLLLASGAIPILTAVALYRWVTRIRVLVAMASIAIGLSAVLGASALLTPWPGSMDQLLVNAWEVHRSLWGELQQLSQTRGEWEQAIGNANVKELEGRAKGELGAAKATARAARKKEQGDYLQEAIALYRRASEQLFQAQRFIQDLGGGVTMKFAPIPAGEFLMGNAATEEGRYQPGRSESDTPHAVALIKPFYMQASTVTQAQWQAIMGNNPSHFHGDDLPVENVTWNDAVAFCRQLSQKAGKHFRLPTEAEWEYACHAGTQTAYGGTGNLDEMGWYDRNSDGQTHPVAQKKPNAWNLYDMHGNVWQWCADSFGVDSDRVLRGGSWAYNADCCRAGFRHSHGANSGNPYIGFRICLDF